MPATPSPEIAPPMLSGRVAIVTGGGNGMGEQVVHTLARLGATVVVADLDPVNGERVADYVTAQGGESIFHRVDATDEEAVTGLVATVRREFGRIDILDNNAAALGLTRFDSTVVDTEFDTFLNTLRANTGGPFLMCKHVIPVMIESGGGSIINMASISGLAGELSLTAYGISKAAVIQLTRAVATQYGGQGIRCNTVAPSYVMTPNNVTYAPPALERVYLRQTPGGQIVNPQEVADVVAFLASDASRQINGHLIPVDGGLLGASSIVADFRDAMV